jgi:hypothetical protein
MKTKRPQGNMIKQFLKKDGRKIAWLAEQIPYSESNMYKILQKSSI